MNTPSNWDLGTYCRYCGVHRPATHEHNFAGIDYFAFSRDDPRVTAALSPPDHTRKGDGTDAN